MELYKEVSRVKYEGKDSKNPLAFRFYNPDELISGKTMREHLRFAMSYWHTLCGEGADMFGTGTFDKSFGGKNIMEVYINKANVAFEIMEKLDIDYFCFHDRDIAPEGSTLAESNARLDQIAEYIKDLMIKYNNTNLKISGRYLCGLLSALLRYRPWRASARLRPLPCKTNNILTNLCRPFILRLV